MDNALAFCQGCNRFRETEELNSQVVCARCGTSIEVDADRRIDPLGRLVQVAREQREKRKESK